MEIAKSSKLIGIGEEGIKNLESISHKLNDNIYLEKINIKQDVDKEYVRALLDGIDVLFLTYSSEDKEALNIVKAIGIMANERRVLSIGLNSSNVRALLDGIDVLFLTYSSEDKEALNIVKAIGIMANERRVLSIGLNSSTKEVKDSLEIDREIHINDENTEKLFDIFNMMLDSMIDTCMINIDLTDLKEVIMGKNAIKYSCEEFKNTESQEEIVKLLFDNMIKTKEELVGKKGIVLLEMGSNDFKSEDMIKLNSLLTLIQDSCEDTYESIFSIYLKEELNGKIKVGLIYN